MSCPDDKIIISVKSFQYLAEYAAKNSYDNMRNMRFIFLLYPICLGTSILLGSILMKDGIRSWPAVGAMSFFAVISLIIYFALGKKYNYKYFLKKETESFSNMLYDVEVRHEIGNLEREINS